MQRPVAIHAPAEKPPAHLPVLRSEVLTWLRPLTGRNYVDATVGAGGHTHAILEASAPDGRVLGLDVDAEALALADERLRAYGDRARLEQGSFRDIKTLTAAGGFDPVDGVVFDLGVSSMQLDRPARGFSFAADGPLDMRLDPSSGQSAAGLVSALSERELADLIFSYGEEPAARRIARAIVHRRAITPFRTTTDLARVIGGAAGRGGRASWRIHPATRTFQALRIAVNDELGALEAALPAALDVLAPGGRLVVIAFHSLEDRIVKRFFQAQARDCVCPPEAPQCRCHGQARLRILTRKPVVAGPAEVAANPRSRSAKLRAAEKLGTARSS